MEERYTTRYNLYVERAMHQARVRTLDKEIEHLEETWRFFVDEDFIEFLKIQALTLKVDKDDDDDAQD